MEYESEHRGLSQYSEENEFANAQAESGLSFQYLRFIFFRSYFERALRSWT